MKTTIFILSYLFLTFTTNLASAATNAVVDVDGQELQAGTSYYILPVIRGNGGGGLRLYRGIARPCPEYVVQDPIEVNGGLPANFLPENQCNKTIRVSSDLNIQFPFSAYCRGPTVWRLDRGGYVSTGEVVGNQWFRIEKLQWGRNWYKLVHCPGICDTCKPLCKDIGISFDNNRFRRLVLSDKPFMVFFSKA